MICRLTLRPRMAGLFPGHFFWTIVRLLQNDFHLTGREIFPGQMPKLRRDTFLLKMRNAVVVDFPLDFHNVETSARQQISKLRVPHPVQMFDAVAEPAIPGPFRESQKVEVTSARVTGRILVDHRHPVNAVPAWPSDSVKLANDVWNYVLRHALQHKIAQCHVDMVVRIFQVGRIDGGLP